MHAARIATAVIVIAAAAAAASAQPAPPVLTALETGVACAPPPSSGPAVASPLRVLGSQDTVRRTLFSESDLLVIDGGTAKGVEVNQEFFVRRAVGPGAAYGMGRGASNAVKTTGWVRVIAANETTAIAKVDHACDGISQYDYLDPFVAPTVPIDADRDLTAGEPDFSALGHIVRGDEQRATGGAGDFMLIDWGADHHLTAGGRVAIYRDVHMDGMPLSSIGDAIVVSVGPSQSLTRVTRARDAVRSGDYVVVRK